MPRKKLEKNLIQVELNKYIINFIIKISNVDIECFASKLLMFILRSN